MRVRPPAGGRHATPDVHVIGDSARQRALTRALLAAMPVAYRAGRGYYRLCDVARRHDARVVVTVAPDTRLHVPLGDIYWNTLLREEYEPEIAAALARHLDGETCLLDLGANIGYWTVRGRDVARRTVAVEANPTTFRRLQDNASLNEADPARTQLLNRAVWSSSGETLTLRFHEVHHAAATLVAEDSPMETASWQEAVVETVSVSDLARDHLPDDGSRVIVKLDVEGAEREAVDGAADLVASRPVLFLYEDHGSDPDCRVTRHFLDLGFEIRDVSSGAPLTLEQVAATKTVPTTGYNFAAHLPGRWDWS